MFQQAFRSYIASLHPRNFRKIKDSSGMIFWFYFLFINPAQTAYEGNGNWKFIILFWITTITPFYIMWWSNLGYKLSLSKMMYMLPLKLEERKQYMRCLLVIKIGFPVIIGMVLHLIFAAVYGEEWWVMLISAICICSFGIGMYICSELRSKFDRYIRYAVRGKDGTGKDAWLNWICMIYSVIVMLFFRMAEHDGESGGFIEWIGVIGVISVISVCIVMDIAIMKTRYQDAVNDACNYEMTYNIEGKGQGEPIGQKWK